MSITDGIPCPYSPDETSKRQVFEDTLRLVRAKERMQQEGFAGMDDVSEFAMQHNHHPQEESRP